MFVDQNVLELQVAMAASEVMHVIDRLDHLVHEEASSIFSHRAHGLTQVEEEASLHVFHHDEN